MNNSPVKGHQGHQGHQRSNSSQDKGHVTQGDIGLPPQHNKVQSIANSVKNTIKARVTKANITIYERVGRLAAFL